MKIALFANTDWYLYNFRSSLALALRERGHDVLLLSPDGAYGCRLREMGFRWVPVPLNRRSLNPVREVAFLWRLFCLLRRERVQLLHCFTIKCAVYGSLIARILGVRARVNAVVGLGYVFTSGDTLAATLRPFVTALLRLALGGSEARLILQNRDDAEKFEAAGLIDASKVRLVFGSGVNRSVFTPPDARSFTPARVLLPARLLWDKGLKEYAEAAKLLRSWSVPVDLVLAGAPDHGNPASVPIDTVQSWVNSGLMRWLGHVDDMPSLLRETDIVVLPSYREGLPKGLIEAAASKCALIATDVPGCREVVSHEVDGLLVPSRDGEALAGAIKRLVYDVAFRDRLADSAWRKVALQFDEKIVIERTIEVYRELVAV